MASGKIGKLNDQFVPDNREAVMIDRVIRYLETRNIMCWRQHNNGRFNRNRAANSLLKELPSLAKMTQGNAFSRIDQLLKFGFSKEKNTRKGVADIVAIVSKNVSGEKVGIHVEIEIKIGSDKISPDQEKHAFAVTHCGGYYFLVYDFEVFKTLFEQRFPR
jgi:hypothetical protein